MGGLAVVLGSNALGPDAERLSAAVESGGALALLRHGGPEGYLPPHRIDHEANLRSLADAGCERVLAVCSVGSLKREIPVGSFICPDDFIALQLLITSFDDARGHMAPEFEPEWRERVVAASRNALGGGLRDQGVYWHATGPRFETPAEIRLMARDADLVGMTMAAECVVAGELGLSYAALCVVDNLANGIAPEQISVDRLERDRQANAQRLREALEAIVPELV
jgi:5'-methylthioadenosine phosphorylase